ncbi:MAG TPA: DUF4405 domain-containing protein [Coriobacteriia bacterium]
MRARSRLILDLIIACGLIAAYRPTWTGISLHEWISIAVIAPMAIHLAVNWEWCLRIARTFLQRLFHASRANFVVDVALLVASVAVMLSGVMVSPIPAFFGAQVGQLLVWATLHSWSADASIALFLVHAALHRRWIVATAKRLVPASPSFAGWLGNAPRGGAVPARVPGASAAPALSAAQARRAARLATEKAAARRNASALGVVTVSLALGSLIFTSVAVAGPALSRTLERQAATAGAITVQAATPASVPHAATRKRVAKSGTPVVQSTPAKPKTVTLTCPRTGCTASSCHATYGQSASVYYKTH